MEQSNSDLPKLASPAQRALASAGITRLDQLARMSEAELSRLHGIGPNAIETLRQALQQKELSFLFQTFKVSEHPEGLEVNKVEFADVDEMLKTRFASEWGERVARHLHLSDGFSLAAVSGRTLGGVISVYWKMLLPPLDNIKEGYIDIIEVHPDARRQGIATRLIERSIERVKAHGAYQLRAWTSEEKTAALQMWAALGFGLTPTTTYPGGKEVRGYFVTKPLS